MAYEIKLEREFTNSTFLPPTCVVTGKTEGAVIRRVEVRTPLPGIFAKYLESEISLPFTGFAWRLWRLYSDQYSPVGMVIVLVWFTSILVQPLLKMAPNGVMQVVWLIVGTFAVCLVAYSVYATWSLPKLKVVDSFGGVLVSFPHHRKALYDQYCTAYAQWQAKKGDPRARLENDTDDWANQLPNTWDEAAAPQGPEGG